MRALILLLACLPAAAQVHINFPNHAACAAAAASVVGPAGGSIRCITSSYKTVTVPPTGIPVACEAAKDNHVAITDAVTQAKLKGVPVLLPAGICSYGDVINLDGVKMIGKGDTSVLFAINPSRSAIYLRGSGSEVRSVKMSGVTPSARGSANATSRIVALGATQFVIDNVTIDTSMGAGIYVGQASSHGTISNSRISNTLADSIHLTDKSSHILVQGNRIEGSGDDGVAVVSYADNGGPVRHVTAVGNTIANSKGGRSMSVVGGENVLYEHNRMSNSGNGACLYLAQETGWKTLGVRNVVARYNTMVNCGGPVLDHSAVMVFSGGTYPNEAVTLLRNDIMQATTQSGIRAFGPQTGIVVESNRITAGRPLRLPADIVAVPYTSGAVGAR